MAACARTCADSYHNDDNFQEPFHRALSFSIQLTDPGDYEGGLLEVAGPGNASNAQGTAVLFPSYSLHRVHPVTSGERWSIVSWWWLNDEETGATHYAEAGQRSLQRFAEAHPAVPPPAVPARSALTCSIGSRCGIWAATPASPAA